MTGCNRVYGPHPGALHHPHGVLIHPVWSDRAPPRASKAQSVTPARALDPEFDPGAFPDTMRDANDADLGHLREGLTKAGISQA